MGWIAPKKWTGGRMLGSVAFIYGCVCLLVYFYSERLMFLPPRPSYKDGPAVVKLYTDKKEQIAARYLQNPQAQYTILFSHGNAEDLGDLEPFLQEFVSWGFNVLAYDYPGYGLSQGQPSEAGSCEAIAAAYKYLRQAQQIPPEKILLLGRSIGGGPTLELASSKPVGGVILESTFTSAFRVVTKVSLFPFDRFRNIQKIKKVTSPILVVHGTKDQVIPFSHGQQLFEAAPGIKQSFWVSGADHNNVMQVAGEAYRQALQDFVQQIEAASK